MATLQYTTYKGIKYKELYPNETVKPNDLFRSTFKKLGPLQRISEMPSYIGHKSGYFICMEFFKPLDKILNNNKKLFNINNIIKDEITINQRGG